MQPILYIVIPCYNEEQVLPITCSMFLEKIKSLVQKEKISDESRILFVNDGSKDKTLEVIKKLSEQDECIHYVSFSRNFGKEAAMYAGFEHANGEYVVTMDVDLQDPPHLIPEMIRCIEEEGYDSVATRRVTRKGEPPIRSFFARRFYGLINKISDADIVDGARDFRMMKRDMVNAILSMPEYNRFTKGIFGWVGFKTKWLDFENVERSAGETKWSVWKLFRYSLEGITGFSVVPLALASVLGILFCGLDRKSVV